MKNKICDPRILTIATITLLIVAMTGCQPDCTKTNTVFIRDTTYIVKPDTIQGRGFAQVVTDTIIKYSEINKKNDTVVYFEYLPRKNIVSYIVIPDSIFIKVRDTLNSVRTEYKVIEYPFWSKAGLAVMFLLTGILAGYIIKSRLKNESEDNN